MAKYVGWYMDNVIIIFFMSYLKMFIDLKLKRRL